MVVEEDINDVPIALYGQEMWRRGNVFSVFVGPDIEDILEKYTVEDDYEIPLSAAMDACNVWVESNLAPIVNLVAMVLNDWDSYPDIDNLPTFDKNDYDKLASRIDRDTLLNLGVSSLRDRATALSEQLIPYIPVCALLDLEDGMHPLYDVEIYRHLMGKLDIHKHTHTQ